MFARSMTSSEAGEQTKKVQRMACRQVSLPESANNERICRAIKPEAHIHTVEGRRPNQ